MISKLGARSPVSPSDLEVKEKVLSERLALLEDQFEQSDKKLAQTLGTDSLQRLDHETEEDRSWHDFSDKNLSWAIDSVWYTASPEVREILAARWQSQAEIDRAQQELYRTRGEIAALDQTPFVDRLVYDVLESMFGFPRPKTVSTK